MDITELQIGDWVYCSEKAQFPMRITGILQDSKNGTVYLDFEGNEGDVFESEIGNIAPIPITLDLLEKNGFELLLYYSFYTTIYTIYTCGREITVKLTRDKLSQSSYWEFDVSTKRNTLSGAIRYVHELQNLIRFFGIEWEVRL